MAKVVFVEHNGIEHKVEGDNGQTLMQLALDNAVPGIDADCGGGCACGTCHVLIEAEWLAKANSVNSSEASMIEMAPDRSENSRLACQVQVSDALDGMVVKLPEFQM